MVIGSFFFYGNNCVCPCSNFKVIRLRQKKGGRMRSIAKKIGFWTVMILIYAVVFIVVNAKFMPTPEMLKTRVEGWTSVVMEKDTYLNEVIVKYCKNYHKVDFVSLKDLTVIENPEVKQGVQYNIRKGDVIKFPQIR